MRAKIVIVETGTMALDNCELASQGKSAYDVVIEVGFPNIHAMSARVMMSTVMQLFELLRRQRANSSNAPERAVIRKGYEYDEFW